MKRQSILMRAALLGAILGLLATCSSSRGTLVFTANGEDFVRQGFVDKQGWSISFDHVFVNLSQITAYNKPQLKASLPGTHWIDLAEGGADAPPRTVGKAKTAPGNYQSLKFRLSRAAGGDYPGSTIVMIGTAKRDGKTVPFTIKLDEEITFDGKEGYVGDERKGVVNQGASASVEMTFHFDHIFGDNDAPADDHINTGSVGFDFFNRRQKDGRVTVSQKELRGAPGYQTLVKAIWTLGHLGEGHCEASQTSTSLQ